jgi:predicted nucleic acid-binding protein
VSRIVIDASVVGTWIFGDEQTPASLDLLRKIKLHEFVVPAIWTTEITNLLLVAVRSGRLPAADLSQSFARLSKLRLRITPPPTPSESRALYDFAAGQRLTAYDAAYVMLARDSASVLATRDREMIFAAGRLGVELLPL